MPENDDAAREGREERRSKYLAGARLSKDEKWRAFPRVPKLLQYVNTGTYFGRVKIGGKIIRQSLETSVFTTAKLRLVDFLKVLHEPPPTPVPTPPEVPALTFEEAKKIYEHGVETNTGIKPSTKEYRGWCIKCLLSSWPELASLKLAEISDSACRDWAAKLQGSIGSQYFNNVIDTMRLILAKGITEQVKRGGIKLENPAQHLNRAKVSSKRLTLPERIHFYALLENIRLKSGGWGHKAADLLEFLAYSGLRLNTEALHVTWEDVDWQRQEIVVRGDPETGTKNWEIRRIPIIPDMETLLARLKEERGGSPTGKIVETDRCYETLKRACEDIGIPRITHHDLRHLFATRCIEAGVDIPTVARWLGHKDGGALAMKVYGHLRNEHSQEMAKKVRF